MDEKLYKTLVRIAVVLGVLWVGWSIYEGGFSTEVPGAHSIQAAAKHLQDERNEDALREYEDLLTDDPGNIYALRGKAQALMQMGHSDEALPLYDEAIRREPGFGVTYAVRGILKDRMEDYGGALADYEMALELEPKVADGPGFFTRFLRNQAEKPPTIADRARYLREQLSRTEGERLLRVPEKDEAQRPYKM